MNLTSVTWKEQSQTIKHSRWLQSYNNYNICENVPKSPIDNKAALDRVMVWRQTGDKPLPEPMLTPFTDTYMQH